MVRIVLTGGQVFDGTGADFVTADVAIEGSIIVAVGPGLDGDVEVVVDGATVLPGLIDAHVHAGVRTVEHGTHLDDEAIELMLARATWLLPTLGVGQFIVDMIERGAAVPAGMAEKAQANFALREDSFRRRVAVGVRLAMGSDSAGESHGDNLIQLRLMHEMRLDGLAVLRAATGSAATLMGVANRIGFIRADHQADLTVVDGDPLDFRAYPANVRHAYRPGAHCAASDMRAQQLCNRRLRGLTAQPAKWAWQAARR